MKKNIILDLDDSLADFANHIIETFNLIYNKDFKKEDKDDYSFSVYDLNEKEFVQAMIDNNIIENIKPFFGAKQTLDCLHQTHDIHIVTARSWHPNGYNITKKWFENFELPYDSIRLVYPGNSKKEAIKDLVHVAIAVDDRDTHCKELSECKNIDTVLMVNQPWNKYATGNINRINNIMEILYYV